MTTSRQTTRRPQVGDWADHVSRDLDPREVTAVSKDGTQIKIWILTSETPWLPAENYTYAPPRKGTR